MLIKVYTDRPVYNIAVFVALPPSHCNINENHDCESRLTGTEQFASRSVNVGDD